MNDIYKVEIKASDYPKRTLKVRPLSTGDTIFIKDTNPVRVGDWYRDYPAKVHQVFYESKKWWQFWKKKGQIGYLIRWQ